jgi:DUF4097 and DUF4098 domain-containing protein YvlB
MTTQTGFRLASLALTVAAITVGPACVEIVGSPRYTEREEKRFPVSGQPDVSLSTFNGSIEVRPSERSEVTVTIERRAWSKEAAAQIEVRAEQTGNRVVVDVRMPKGVHMLGFNQSASANLIVSLPAASDVQARSGDGSIDIERVTGTVDLRSGDGSINGRDLGSSVKVHTGDGSIKLTGVKGSLDVDTGDGSITAEGAFTSVRARSGDGSVTINAAPGSSASDEWTITTGDGSVVLAVPEGFGGELDAHTGDGAIEVHDVTLSNVTGRISRNTVRGRLGNGGSAVRVRTGDGTITLRKS